MTSKKTLLLVCIILLGAGLTLYLTGFALGARVIGVGFSNQGFQINTLPNASDGSDLVYVEQEITLDDFSSIDVQLDFAVVTLMPSDHFGLVSRTKEDSPFTYDIVNGCLRLREQPSGISISGGFNFTLFGTSVTNTFYKEPNRITVYFPAGTRLTSVSGSCDGTEMTMYDITADTMDISLDFGSLTMENSEAVTGSFNLNSGSVLMEEGSFGTLSMENNFGNINIRQVNVSQSVDVTLDSGTFTLEDTQCDKFNFSGSFNTVNVDTLSAASVKMQTDSGKIQLYQLTSDSIEITNDFGNVDLKLTQPLESYGYDVSTEFGHITIDGSNTGTSYHTLFDRESTDKWIKIYCNSCDISINPGK